MREKSIISFLALLLSISIFSCKKDSPTRLKQSYLQTSFSDIKTDSTSVTLKVAAQLAQKFLQDKNPNQVVSLLSGETIIKNGIPYIHIFNANNNAGFVMISADSLYAPILAYNTEGNFDKNNLNTGLVLWFNKHSKNLDFIRNSHDTYFVDSVRKRNKLLWIALGGNKAAIKKGNSPTNGGSSFKPAPPDPVQTEEGADVATNNVGPLCTVSWSQNYPYNQYCPAGTGGLSSSGFVPAGCVPVAMAQIMYFWQYPTTYNWGSMVRSIDPNNATTWPSNNPSGFTESAKLIHDIGATEVHKTLGFSSGFVDYNVDGSSANDTWCLDVFGYMGYTGASRTQTISDQVFSGAKNGVDYAGFIRNEISNNQRPCMIGGYTDRNSVLGLVYWPAGAAHEWVCDGVNEISLHQFIILTYNDRDGNFLYEQKLYIGSPYTAAAFLHMNWGWGPASQGGPSNTGWYNYNINYTGAPDGNDFQYFQTIIFNIHP